MHKCYDCVKLASNTQISQKNKWYVLLISDSQNKRQKGRLVIPVTNVYGDKI